MGGEKSKVKWIAAAVAMLAQYLLAFPVHAQQMHEAPHRFDNPARWARQFDNPERDAWQKPDEVIAALALRPNARVADVGAGTGYFTMRLAKATPEGVVFAVDLEDTMLAHIGARAKNAGLGNVRTIKGDTGSPNLPEPVDLVLIVNTYHHIDARPDYMKKVAAMLAPGGRVAIVDFRLDAERGAPKHMRLATEKITQEMALAGLGILAAHEFLPSQTFLIFGVR
jgi:ubiquinone/menaquinone biosynthesis C-methylase UbiE